MKYLFGAFFLVCCVVGLAQEKLARPDVPGEIMVDIGLNFLDEEPNFVDQAGWRSKSIGIYYTKRRAFNDKFSFYYGLGLGLEKISLGDSLTLSSGVVFNEGDGNPENDSLAAVALTSLSGGINYSKNRLAITYLDIPVEFRFHPKGTQDGEGLFVGVGGILGLRMNSHRKLKFEEGGETVIEKTKGGYNLTSVRYGLQARFGFRGVHLFYKQYFNDIFKDSFGSVSPTMSTIGINVTGF